MNNRFYTTLLTLLSCLSILLLASPVAVLAQEPAPQVTDGYTLYFPRVYNGPSWTTERIDAPRNFGELGSRTIVVMPDNRPCITYGNDHLYLRCDTSEGWMLQTVDPAYGVGRWASIALDASGLLHIAYYDEIRGALKYARQTGGGWAIQTVEASAAAFNRESLAAAQGVDQFFETLGEVEPQGVTSSKWGVGGYPSIAVDSAGRAHISYYDFAGKDLKYAAWTGSAWQIQTVDATGNAGEANSIGVNAAGTVYIAYHESTLEDVKLATKNGNDWALSVISSTNKAGRYTSLAMAKDGTPRVAFYSVEGHCVYYWDGVKIAPAAYHPSDEEDLGHYASLALDNNDTPWIAFFNATRDVNDAEIVWKDGNYWERHAIDTQDIVGRNTSLAIGPNNRPQMAYYHSSNNQLRIASGEYDTDDRKWDFSFRALDTTTTTGIYTSIDLDSQNHPVGVYLNDSQSRLMFAQFDGAGWQIQTCSSDNDTGVQASLDMTANDVPYITFWQYISGTETQMRFIYRENTKWRSWPAENGTNLGNYSSVKADANNNAHVSYYNAALGDLHYARMDPNTGWHRVSVDTAGDTGLFTSLALDTGGNPWISYYDATNGDLRLARWNGSGFDLQTVDSTGDVGAGNSLALDANNHPRIAYLDATNHRLKFAAWNGSSWSYTYPDPAVNVGGAPSLQLDAAGHAYIAYYDYAAFDLKYAFQTGSTWMIEVIDAEGDVGSNNDLVLGADGRAHVLYFDATNGDAKYALRKNH